MSSPPGKVDSGPVLASDALRDDVAPVEPWRRSIRGGLIAIALVYAATPWLSAPGLPHASKGSAFGLALAACVTALAPVPYIVRATLALLIGLVASLLGLNAEGPAAPLGATIGWSGLWPLVAVIALPATLMFRARYRTYARTRRVLAAGYLCCLPFIGYALALLGQGSVTAQVTAGLSLLLMVSSLVGFSPTGGHVLSVSIAATLTVSLGVHIVATMLNAAPPLGWQGILVAAIGAVAFTVSGALAALASFQVLAHQHWERARRVDIKREEPPVEDDAALSDSWTSR